MMGSLEKERGRHSDEKRHPIIISKPFWMSKYEITQKQWQAVMGENPSEFKGEDLPVETVSWEDCQKFCKKMEMQLPTEAQWEYACRAGTTSAS